MFFNYAVQVEVNGDRETTRNVYPTTLENAQKMVNKTIKDYFTYCTGKEVKVIYTKIWEA